MNGFRKNKGIVIELTALLDVIMIMLFWIMMNVQDSSKSAASEAEKKALEAEQRLNTIQEELDIRSAQLERFKSILENIDKNAADNQQALLGYESGMLVTLDIRYDTTGRLIIYNSDQKLGEAEISSETEITASIINSLNKAGLDKQDVVLCALIYDGTSALYRDFKTVNRAVNSVRKVYSNFYCAYINTAKINQTETESATKGW